MLTTLVLGVALGAGDPIHRGPRPETCGEKSAAPVVVDEDLCAFEVAPSASRSYRRPGAGARTT
jgi:hypothetical protein